MELRYFLRKDRPVRGKYPIRLRVTIKGDKSHYKTPHLINKESWIQTSQLAIGSENNDLNASLIDLKKKCEDMYLKNPYLTAIKICEVLGAKKSVDLKLSEIISRYAEYNEEAGTLAPATIKKYRWIAKNVAKFDSYVEYANRKYCNDLWWYFKKDMGLAVNTANKYYEQTMSAVNYALKKGWIEKHGMVSVREAFNKAPIVYLTQDEIDRIRFKEFGSDRLDKMRDIFVFQIYTGCEYGRVRDLMMDDIQLGVDGLKWIFTTREKTTGAGNLTLLPIPLALIDKYKDDPCRSNGKVFPVNSNAKSNEYLKEIGALCGIKKRLHTHLARHTFATTICILNSVPFSATAKMMGITQRTCEDNYGAIAPELISHHMRRLTNIMKSDDDDKDQNPSHSALTL